MYPVCMPQHTCMHISERKWEYDIENLNTPDKNVFCSSSLKVKDNCKLNEYYEDIIKIHQSRQK